MNRFPTLLITVLVTLAFLPSVGHANSGDFDGGVAIGASYAGVDSAPTNGLIIQGNVGIGTSTVSGGNLSIYGGNVNGINLSGSSTGSPTTIAVAGSDTNIGLNLTSKGTGQVEANSLPVVDKVVVQKFSSSGTYTPTAGMVYATIECMGGGGAGGGITGSTSYNATGSGGGAGGYSRVSVAASAIGASKTVTIGSGGAHGTAGNNAGGNGIQTSVGTLCVANGGIGAPGSTYNGANVAGGGATAGTGDIAAPGAPGAPASTILGSSGFAGYFCGASTPWGGGGCAGFQANGGNASGYGAGGGGGNTNGTATSTYGGNGAPGYVVITEYLSQ